MVMSFNRDICGFILENGEKIIIEKEDVHAAYGVPIGGIEINEPKSDVQWEDFLKQWRSSFGLIKGSPTCDILIKELRRSKKSPVDDIYLRHFVLFDVNSCIKSNTNY
ncbi:hypothetical protein M5689_012978 [Euphorbia peplus]|nr:hypothetical protein M5689_012978 [Euphorbia peplus]